MLVILISTTKPASTVWELMTVLGKRLQTRFTACRAMLLLHKEQNGKKAVEY